MGFESFDETMIVLACTIFAQDRRKSRTISMDIESMKENSGSGDVESKANESEYHTSEMIKDRTERELGE